MSTRHAVNQITTNFAFLICLSLAGGLSVASKENSKVDLPSEIRNLSDSQLTVPPRTVLSFTHPDSMGADTATAVVWLKFRTDQKVLTKGVKVVYCSHPKRGFEERAKAALQFRALELIPAEPPEKPQLLYHEVFFSDSLYWATHTDSASVLNDFFDEPSILPEIIYFAQPEYPRSAKQAGMTGTVWIRVFVNAAGEVDSARVAKSSDHDVLDKAALKAAFSNKFKPAVVAKKPVPSWTHYRVDFELEP